MLLNSKYIFGLLVSALMIFSCSGQKTTTESTTDSSLQSPALPRFSADSAYNFIQRQVDFGPRVPGSDAHAACHDFIVSRMQQYGAEVQQLDSKFPAPDGRSVDIRNILARFNPDAKYRIMLLAHYDTRPWADRDSDPAAYKTPIDGANDGASGVAVLLEMARLFSTQAPGIGVDMLFVDYEDSGTYAGPDEEWCLGSQAYAASLTPASQRPNFAILLDMVGGPDAVFPREMFSNYYAREIVDLVWRKAKEAGEGARFIDSDGGAINDDHYYLLQAGIPAIDIIESANPITGSFNPTWHTLDDNIKNIDRATLQSVGNVITNVIYTK